MSEDTMPTAFDGSTSAFTLADIPEPPAAPASDAPAAGVTGSGGFFNYIDWGDGQCRPDAVAAAAQGK